MGKFLRCFLLIFLFIGGGCGQTAPSKLDGTKVTRTADSEKNAQTAKTEKKDRVPDKKKSHTRELDDSELPWGRPAEWETETPLAPGISY